MTKMATLSDSSFVCSLEVDAMLGDFDVDVRFSRGGGRDRLFSPGEHWLKAEEDTQGTEEEAVIAMMPRLIEGCRAYAGTPKLVSPGLLSEEQFAELMRAIDSKWDAIRDANSTQAAAAVVVSARSLGLSPSPSFRQESMWDANCPGTHHQLLLNTARNEFWCGYCRRSGGIDALEDFVKERRT